MRGAFKRAFPFEEFKNVDDTMACSCWSDVRYVQGWMYFMGTGAQSEWMFASSSSSHTFRIAVENIMRLEIIQGKLRSFVQVDVEPHTQISLATVNTGDDIERFFQTLNHIWSKSLEHDLSSAEGISAAGAQSPAPVASVAAATSAAAAKIVHEAHVFPIPSEQLISSVSVCWLWWAHSYVKGTLLVSNNFLCFLSPSVNLTIAFGEITYVLSAATLFIYPNGLTVVTTQGSVFFTIPTQQRNPLITQLKSIHKRSLCLPPRYPTSELHPQNAESNEWNPETFAPLRATCIPVKCAQLTELCLNGIPDAWRARLWVSCSGALTRRMASRKDAYARLLSKMGTADEQTREQIEKDLRRSSDHPMFQTDEGIDSLRRVLTAFAVHNPVIGYCQGLNLISSLFLTYMDEESAFWLLMTTCEEKMTDFYRRSMVGALVAQDTFEFLLRELHPDLWLHFEKQQFSIALISQAWFLCIFIGVLPEKTMLRVMDAFFNEGSVLLLKIALALLKLNEAVLLKAKELPEFVDALKQCNYSPQSLMRAVGELVLPVEHLEARKMAKKKELVRQLRARAKKRLLRNLSHTDFSDDELAEMLDRWNFFTSNTSELATFPAFQSCFEKELPNQLAAKVFTYLDPQGTGFLSFEDCVPLLSALTKGTIAIQFERVLEIYGGAEQICSRATFSSCVAGCCMLNPFRNEYGVCFIMDPQKIAVFVNSIMGQHPDATISVEEAQRECIKSGRLRKFVFMK